MYKIIGLVILLISLQTFLIGQQLRSEKVGDTTILLLLLPYSGFHPNLQTRICDYELKVDILDTNKKNVYHEFEPLKFTKPDSMDTEDYPIFRNIKLPPGNYMLYMQVNNLDLGDKNEQKFPLIIPSNGKKIGTLFLIGKMGNNYFLVHELDNLSSKVDSLLLQTNLGIIPDSVKISIAEEDKIKIINISAGQVIHVDMKSILAGLEHPVIKLQVFAQKVKYTKEVLSFNSTSGFSERYSIEDQVLQLKYIMNQNELQYFRSIKHEKDKQAIEDFWKMKDPTPGTNRNEFRDTFEARVLEADRNYSIRNYRPGWKSDRGRIFIKYGTPDEVVSDPYPLDRPPYIIWYYYSENKIFQFYDFNSWGNYQLGSVSDE